MTTDTILTSGQPVPADNSYTELKPNGQQQAYVVLTPEERGKGFVRPYRDSYIHVGAKLRGELEMLDGPQVSPKDGKTYVAIDRFMLEVPGREPFRTGRFLTQAEVDQVKRTGRIGGCGTRTQMARSIAETYARDPKFYGGTFCCHCKKHLPLHEFVWEGTDETVGG